MSITGKPPDLVHFAKLANEKREKFVDEVGSIMRDGIDFTSIKFKEVPVFITTEECKAFEDMCNCTSADLKVKLENMLSGIHDSHM